MMGKVAVALFGLAMLAMIYDFYGLISTDDPELDEFMDED